LAKSLSPPSQIDVEGRRHRLAPALSLQALKQIHRAIKLPVRVNSYLSHECRIVRNING
jgi:hypothetical protein